MTIVHRAEVTAKLVYWQCDLDGCYRRVAVLTRKGSKTRPPTGWITDTVGRDFCHEHVVALVPSADPDDVLDNSTKAESGDPKEVKEVEP